MAMMLKNSEYVQLKSALHRTYLHAAEDGKSVILDASKTSHNSVWAVEYDKKTGSLRLRGAYGKYLGAPGMISSLLPCPRVAAAQLDADEEDKKAIKWRIVDNERVLSRSMDFGRDRIELKCDSGPFLHLGVCFSACFSAGESREWEVYNVRPTYNWPDPPLYVDRRQFSFRREIHWVVAERGEQISSDDDDWGKFEFVGRDRTLLEEELKVKTKGLPVTFFVRAGRYGRPAPLCTHLARNQDPFHLIGFWDSPGTEHHVFPNVPRESPAMGEGSLSWLQWSLRLGSKLKKI